MLFINQNQGTARNYSSYSTELLPVDQMLTVKQVATWLQVSPKWVYRHWRKLGGVKLIGKIRFDRRIVERNKELN